MELMYNANELSRSEQRGLVLHLLYTYECNDALLSPESICFMYKTFFECIIESESRVMVEFSGVLKQTAVLESEIEPFLKRWKLERIALITRIVLRYAMWELYFGNVDHALVINEAIELCKTFSEPESHRLVNGVLDAWSKKNPKS